MPIHTHINSELHCVERIVEGEFNFNKFFSSFHEIDTVPGFVKGMDALWDLRQADLSQMSVDTVDKISHYIANNTDKRGVDYRIALVVSTDLAYGLARMFRTMSDQIPVNINIFRSMDDACDWLKATQQ
ncbi:MAG: hypothetical protein OEY43_00435 [Gammaproteobacteria bacterium]|nr:hypothetical protein [Gammaproteobacteria bacterium]